MKCIKECILMKKEVVKIEYDSFEEYVDHLMRMESRGYDAKKVVATHTSEKMNVRYERLEEAQ